MNRTYHNDDIANDSDDDDDYGMNMIIVMNSDSGKPIYSCSIQNSRTNNSHQHHTTSLSSQIATICSIIHTLQTLSLSVSSSSSSSSSGLGHLQSVKIHSNNANDSTNANDRIVFMHVPPRFTFLVFVVGNVGCCGAVDSYIRVRLEYIYTRFIMTCTDIASSSIHHHPFYYPNNSNNNNNDDDVEQVFQQNQHFISSLFETRRISGNIHHHHHPFHSIHPASILTSGILPASFYNHNHAATTTTTTPIIESDFIYPK